MPFHSWPVVLWPVSGIAFVYRHGSSSSSMMSRAALSNRGPFEGQKA